MRTVNRTEKASGPPRDLKDPGPLRLLLSEDTGSARPLKFTAGGRLSGEARLSRLGNKGIGWEKKPKEKRREGENLRTTLGTLAALSRSLGNWKSVFGFQSVCNTVRFVAFEGSVCLCP